MDELEYLRIKDRAWESLSKTPGVHAVGIGKKVTGGVRTDETVLAVFVAKKLPADKLSAEAVVPPVFEGIKTDILERPMPCEFQAPITVAPPEVIANGMRFTFTTTVDPPPKGFRIVMTTTLHSTAPDLVGVFTVDSDGVHALAALLDSLAHQLDDFKSVRANTTLAVSVLNTATDSLDASCYILSFDIRPYADEYLRGGILIQAGAKEGGGTLGCLATLAPTPEYPKGRVVGITCGHVVRDFITASTQLREKTIGNTAIELSVAPTVPPTPVASIRPHTVISIVFFQKIVQASTFYTTRQDESLADIAKGLAAAINATGLTGVNANVPTVSAATAHIPISGFSAPDQKIYCQVHGPPQFQGDSPLDVNLAKGSSGDHTITFSGSGGDSANVGVFVDIDGGGFGTTFGVFHSPPRKQQKEDVAQAISTAINLLPSAQRGLVSATATGATVTIVAAMDVRVRVQLDMRIGQPIPFFGTGDARCCNFRIGRVVAARQDLDVALVQIDPGMKYKYHIQEMNAVAGTQSPSLGLPVQKRGAATGVTEGVVSAIAVSGFITNDTRSLVRTYRNAFIVDSTILDTPKTRRAFAGFGDSGSVVLTTGPGVPKVVGVLWAGDVHATAMMTPIDDIVSGFAHLGLAFDPAVGVDLSAVHTVPAAAMSIHPFEANPALTPSNASSAGSLAAFGERMQETGRELAATPIGREYGDVIRRHLPEALGLVNHNRRVATVWHRCGGPALFNAVLRTLRFDEEPLPREINGQPIAECIATLENIFRRYASRQLGHDMARIREALVDFSGMTYPQVLTALRAGQLD
jgi:hypothetical protein